MLSEAWKHRFRIYLISITGIICSVFFCKPHNNTFDLVKNPPYVIKFESLMVKKSNLTDNLTMYSPTLHEAKGVFRLTVPVLMRIFGIETLPQLYMLQLVVGILLYLLMAALAYQCLHSYWASTATVIAISATYFGRAYFLDTYPWLDTFGFFFAILAIWGRKYWWVVILSIVALFFTDERGAICAGLVFVSIKLLEMPAVGNITLKNIISFRGPANYVLLGLLVAVCVRAVLMFGYNMSTPLGQVGYTVFLKQWKTVQLGMFDGLVGLWGIFFMAVLHMIINRKWLVSLLIVCSLMPFVLVALSVHDITRSIVYVVPLVFVCLKYLKENMADTGYFIAGITFINLMFPHGFVIKDMVFNNTGYPILFDIFFKVKGALGL